MHKKCKCEELGGEFARLTKTSVKPPKYREMGSGMTDFWDNVNLHKENSIPVFVKRRFPSVVISFVLS